MYASYEALPKKVFLEINRCHMFTCILFFFFFFFFVLLLYVPSQQLWSLRDGQFTLPHFFLGRLEQAVNQ